MAVLCFTKWRDDDYDTDRATHSEQPKHVSGEDVITVEMGEGRHQDCEKGLASFDGDSEIR